MTSRDYLASNDKIKWYAGRNMTFRGKYYEAGDPIPEANDHDRLENLVRSRHVIPVVEDIAHAPFQWRHTVVTRERAERKLQRTLGEYREKVESTPRDPALDENEFDPGKHTIDEVMEYVEENPEEVLSVYALEEQGKNRPNLKSKLDEILNHQAEAENEEHIDV